MMVNKKLCPAYLTNHPSMSLKSVDYVTIHTTGNRSTTATARSHADYQYGGSGGVCASWHYTVDQNEIWQSFEDYQRCWHATDGTNGPGNSTSIAIEICVNSQSGFKNACDKAAWLTAELLKRHNLTIDRVVQHSKWTNKNCPAELRSGEWDVTWNDFIALVQQYASTVPTGTPIMGASILTAQQLAAFLLSKNPEPKINCTAAELAALFIAEGNAEGVRGDIAFCQSCHETGYFKYGGSVVPEQNNYAGIGAVDSATDGAWFDSPQLGARAQVQHLKAYASTEQLNDDCVDPRFHLVKRGSASSWEGLGGKWAVPGYDKGSYDSFAGAFADGATYGQKIMQIYESVPKLPTVILDFGKRAVPAVNKDGNFYVTLPDGKEYMIRDILAGLGCLGVSWDDDTKTITAG